MHQYFNRRSATLHSVFIHRGASVYVHACDYDVIYFPHMKNIMGIAVSSQCRRLGIGKALLSKIEDWARESGAAGVRLVSGSERTEAHLFYKHCGYNTGKMQLNFKKRVSYDIR